MKNIIDLMFRQFAFNLRVTFRLLKGAKILEVSLVKWIGAPGHQNPGKKASD
jgi:hypothetical protein